MVIGYALRSPWKRLVTLVSAVQEMLWQRGRYMVIGYSSISDRFPRFKVPPFISFAPFIAYNFVLQFLVLLLLTLYLLIIFLL